MVRVSRDHLPDGVEYPCFYKRILKPSVLEVRNTAAREGRENPASIFAQAKILTEPSEWSPSDARRCRAGKRFNKVKRAFPRVATSIRRV